MRFAEQPVHDRQRGGFTLLELLVVVAIIAVLASLLLAAIFRATLVARQVQARNDISQLSAAIANFKQDFMVDYLPSQFPSQADPTYWNRLFPQAGPYPGPALSGSQCLAFFLGGVNGQGFSSNPINPGAALMPGSGEIRKGPYFSFPANRLTGPIPGGMFCDPYTNPPANPGNSLGTPYAYFALMRGVTNAYNPGDNLGLPGHPAPYAQPSGQTYINPDSFQIISAGKNGIFGSGGSWPGGVSPAGFDDIANFAAAQLGAGQ